MKNTLLAVLPLVALFFLLKIIGIGYFGAGDFLEYWAGAKLFWSGGNPYDLAQMAAIQKPYNQAPVTILLWNPPIIFPLILPFAAFSFSDATLLWVFVLCAALSVSILKLSHLEQYLSATKSFRITAGLFLITFYPFVLALSYGQISPVLLLGLVGYLYFRGSESGRGFLAGLCLALTLLKPHALYLLYLVLFFKDFRTGNWGEIKGLVFGAALLLLGACLFRPDILSLYIAALQSPPIYWQTPTLGSWLQGLIGLHATWVRLLPSAFFAILLCALLIWRRELCLGQSFMMLIIPVSLLSSPYTWQFDHVLLVPSVLFAISEAGKIDRVSRQGLYLSSLFVVANILMIALSGGSPMQNFVWYPALIAFLIWLAARFPSGNSF